MGLQVSVFYYKVRKDSCHADKQTFADNVQGFILKESTFLKRTKDVQAEPKDNRANTSGQTETQK